MILKQVREIRKGYLGKGLKFLPISFVRVSVIKWIVFLLDG